MTKIALITGASFGVGECMAKIMIEHGWVVLGVARTAEKLQHLHAQLGQNFIPIACDVSEPEQIKIVSAHLQAKNLMPSLFFLDAGIHQLEAHGLDMAIETRTFSTNYFGVMNWVDAWLTTCLERGGTFISMSSALVLQPSPHSAGYCASKAALSAAFEALRVCHAETKVSFVTVIAGAINTSILGFKSDKKMPLVSEPHDVALTVYKKTLAGKEKISLIPYRFRLILFFLSFLPKKRTKQFFDNAFK